MRRAAVFVLLLGCSSEAFSTPNDSGTPVPDAETVDAAGDAPTSDATPDGKADAGDGGVLDAAPDVATCSMPKAPILPASDRCSVMADPACSSACGNDAGPALQGYTCNPSPTAFDDMPSWLAPFCFVSPTDAGTGKRYCCSLPNACVRNSANDSQCTQFGVSKYAWDCPGPGNVNIANTCSGAGCACTRNSGAGLACCPTAGP